MKNVLLLTLVFATISITGFAQVKAPKLVLDAFKQKFPDVTSVKWQKEDTHEYEATFHSKGVKTSANFSDTGELLETETEIKFSDLPNNIQTAFTTKYPQLKAKTISKIETARGVITYELEMKQAGKTVVVFYSQDGIEIPLHN